MASVALAMLAMPAIATEGTHSLTEFRCGNEFITLPVDLLDTDAPGRVVITVRKSDVIAVAARGFIDLGGGSMAVTGRIAINSVSDERVDASREIRTFGLKGGTYDDVVACLD